MSLRLKNLFNINIIEEDLLESIPGLIKNGYKVYGTKVNGGKSLKSVERCEKFAIIMGNEGNGVRNEVLDLCDEVARIDMNSKCESLNVGVGAGIILYHMYKG